MKTFIKYFLLLAIYTNSVAMDDKDHVSHINPFFSEETESPTKPTGNLNSFGFGTSTSEIFSSTEPEPDSLTKTVRTAQDPQESSAFTYDGSLFNCDTEDLSELTAISTTAPESGMGADLAPDTAAVLDASALDSLLSQLRTSETQSPTPPDSDATSELDITAPARKTRRRSSSAASASSSSASAASSTDVSAPSSTGAPCSSAGDDLLHYCKPLPVHCPWPGCPDRDTCFSPPYTDIQWLTKLSEHIRSCHKQYEPARFFCPHTDCNKAFLCYGVLTEHLLSHNHTATFQCDICAEKKTFNTKAGCKQHVQKLHKQVGAYHCHGAANFSVHSDWYGHIRKCPKLETRIREKRYFWCPCGDACTKEEALRHAKLCERTRDGMVYVDPEKCVASTHDECMKLLNELEKTSGSFIDATSASSSSSSEASPTAISTDSSAGAPRSPIIRKRYQRTLHAKPIIVAPLICPLWPLCKDSVDSTKRVFKHIRDKHKSLRTSTNRWYCTVCKKDLSFDGFIGHCYKKHLDDYRPFKCPFCDGRFLSSGDCNIHIKEKHEGKNYTCQFCKKVFTNTSDWRRHVSCHEDSDGKQIFACPCGKILLSESEKEAHDRDCTWTCSGIFLPVEESIIEQILHKHAAVDKETGEK